MTSMTLGCMSMRVKLTNRLPLLCLKLIEIGAFGIFARLLEDGLEFGQIRAGAEGVELADSIAGGK